MNRIEVIRPLECLLPLVIVTIQDQIRMQWSSPDVGSNRLPCRDKDLDLVVGVGEEQAMGDAFDEVAELLRAHVGDEKIRMVDGKQSASNRGGRPYTNNIYVYR